MKLAIIGYGKMGKIIEQIALGRKHEIVTIDPKEPKAQFKEISQESIGNADVCIDFTSPESVIGNIKAISELGKNLVVGTTGWYDKIGEVEKIVQQNKNGLIWASNFSIGMNIFFKISEQSAKIMDKFKEYDVAGFELHHNKKADSPSGTAKTLAEILEKNISRKTKINYENIDRKIEDNELHFASVRVGSVPGTHTIIFDSKADTIELTHTARSREGFALGSVIAAEWINKKIGLYNISDLMNKIIQ